MTCTAFVRRSETLLNTVPGNEPVISYCALGEVEDAKSAQGGGASSEVQVDNSIVGDGCERRRATSALQVS